MRILPFVLAACLIAIAALAAEPPAGVKRVSTGKYVIDKAFAEATMKDLSPVLQQARAVPYLEKGSMVGYQLMQVDAKGVFGKLGLKDRDIVISLNGKNLENGLAAMQALTSLKGQSHVSVRLKRKGKVLTHVYDVK